MKESNFETTMRSKVKRVPNRGKYDRETVFEILDEGFVCNVGFEVKGQPFVIPTSYGRDGNSLYLHGSATSRMIRELEKGIDVCVSVTHLDGLVLARSVFHHSMNYRSVVVFGKAELIEEKEEKIEALRVITEHIIAGRWEEARQPNEFELKATKVLKLEIDEASAKVRVGDPVDDDEDYELDVWAGTIPIRAEYGEPIDDSLLRKGISLPANISDFGNRKGNK